LKATTSWNSSNSCARPPWSTTRMAKTPDKSSRNLACLSVQRCNLTNCKMRRNWSNFKIKKIHLVLSQLRSLDKKPRIYRV
jgi:hypothetical protein